MAEAGVPRKAGSTSCPQCKRTYKNNAVPPICSTDGCEFALGKQCINVEMYINLIALGALSERKKFLKIFSPQKNIRSLLP